MCTAASVLNIDIGLMVSNSDIPRILYIEDEESLAHLVKRRLEREGFYVEYAFNGEEGLARLVKESFEAVIIDYQLPKLTGIEVLQRLRELNSEIPTIMVSGQDDINIVIKAMQLNCRDYLVKDGSSYLELLPIHLKTVLSRRELELDKKKAEQRVVQAQDSLARAQSLAHIGNWEWHVGDESAWWSDEEYRIFGVEKSSGMTGMEVGDYIRLVFPEDRMLVKEMERELLQGKNKEFDYRVLLEDGSVRWLHAKNGVERDERGNIIRWYGTTQDITERRESDKQLLLAQSVFDNTSEAIMLTDQSLRILTINSAFSKITGYQKSEVVGQTPNILKSGKHSEAFYQKMWESLEEKGEWAGEIWNRNKEGEIYPEWLSISVIKDAQGSVEYYVSIFSDISKHKEAEQLIEYQANYDALTGLANRNLFSDRFNTAIKNAQREQSKLGLLFLDLDRFKWVNDTMGHRAGDLLLQESAQRLKSCLRDSDSVSRQGGDEFTFIISNLQQSIDAEVIAEKILAEIAKPYQLDEQQVFISGSIGITIYPDDGTDIETLYRNADNAMYAAKEAGRGQCSFFTQRMQIEANKRLTLLNELREAIDKQQFELYYQPVIDIKNDSLYGAEALIRWNHPKRGVVSPYEFIPLAEETGLINLIGQWVMHEALKQIKQWQQAGYEFHLAVNKSSKQFHSEECAFELQQQMQEMGIHNEQLTIEITETVLMEQQESILTLLKDYSDAGLSLALDDFGTGYSSLSYLRKFPFNIIKIDRSFIMDVTHDKDDATLVETIILMGHKLGLCVLAEGVETEAQRAFLQSNNCDLIQGYFYSKPIPAEEFEQRFFQQEVWKLND